MNIFYFKDLAKYNHHIELTGEEARHLSAARRLGVGDEVTLINGKGIVAKGEIEAINQKVVYINLSSVKQYQLPTSKLILASALPKGDRLSVLLVMATQLGMTGFIPLNCERSVVKSIDHKLDRYKRICLNACKQSGQFFVPDLHQSMSPMQLLEFYRDQDVLMVLADPEARNLVELMRSVEKFSTIMVIVGPEGGFTKSEREYFLSHGVKNINLAKAILRIETAGVCMLAKFSFR